MSDQDAANIEALSASTKPEVIYVKDRPFRALFKQALIVSASAVLLLATIGFIMGFMGLRVPYIDRGAIGNQWSSLTGSDNTDSSWNELEKNP